MKHIKKTAVLAITLTLTQLAYPMSMQQVFDGVNANANVTNPAVLQGQTMNVATGGSLFMRAPQSTYNIAALTPPSFSAGCGGIDLYAGGLSFINKDQFVSMLRNIGSNALGYGFKLAIQNLCPTCDNVMQSLQSVSDAMNKLNINSCEAAKGLVNASMQDSLEKSTQQVAMGFGVNQNTFTDITEAWGKLKNSATATQSTLDTAKAANPAVVSDAVASGNIVWKSLKKISGIDDEYRQILMSMLGTTIFQPINVSPNIIVIPRTNIDVKMLVGQQGQQYVTFPIIKCDTLDADGCLHPTAGTLRKESFMYMVQGKMQKLSDAISTRSAYGSDLAEIIAFINATDLPVYKMIAVTTKLNNTAQADALISRYQDLIAAKYAEVYLTQVATDLNAAINNYSKSSPAESTAKLSDLQPQIAAIKHDATAMVSDAYSRTVNTYNIAAEVQSLERGLNANLSQTLLNSLAFGRSLK